VTNGKPDKRKPSLVSSFVKKRPEKKNGDGELKVSPNQKGRGPSGKNDKCTNDSTSKPDSPPFKHVRKKLGVWWPARKMKRRKTTQRNGGYTRNRNAGLVPLPFNFVDPFVGGGGGRWLVWWQGLRAVNRKKQTNPLFKRKKFNQEK